MTRAMYDLQQYVNTNFDRTNVAGATIEDLAGKPIIEIENDENTDYSYSVNGRIVFQTEPRGASIFLGDIRHKVYFVSGMIIYDSKIKKDDATIQAILDEMESNLNVNNNSTSRSWRWTVDIPTDYNNMPQNGIIEFTIKSIKLNESAIA